MTPWKFPNRQRSDRPVAPTARSPTQAVAIGREATFLIASSDGPGRRCSGSAGPAAPPPDRPLPGAISYSRSRPGAGSPVCPVQALLICSHWLDAPFRRPRARASGHALQAAYPWPHISVQVPAASYSSTHTRQSVRLCRPAIERLAFHSAGRTDARESPRL